MNAINEYADGKDDALPGISCLVIYVYGQHSLVVVLFFWIHGMALYVLNYSFVYV